MIGFLVEAVATKPVELESLSLACRSPVKVELSV